MTETELRSLYVNTARGYYGTQEGSEGHKTIVDLYNSHKPLARGYALKYTDDWCAGFVSAMAVKCGLTDIIPTEVSCPKMIENFKALGRWEENDAYVPQPGDIMMFDWEDTGSGDNTGSPNHVGIVVRVTDGVIRLIEGNNANKVWHRDIPINGRYIRGYCVPDYAKLATKDTSEYFVDVPANAWYREAVDYCKETGLMSGTGEDTFEPDRPVTRAELAAVAARMFDKLGLLVR